MTTLTDNTLLTGELVRLAQWGSGNFEAAVEWGNDSEYLRNLTTDYARPISIETFREMVQRSDEGSHEIQFAIRTLAEDRLIGFVDLEPNYMHRNAWIGIGIGDAAYRGKGYGTDAMRVLVGYAFRELNLYRVTLSVFSYNTRAIRSYEKAGFVPEGRLRGALLRDGQRHDMLVMGILRSEWFARMGLVDEVGDV